MTLDIDEAKVQRNEFRLWLAWTLATALGLLIGYLPLALFIGVIDLGLARVIVPIISGVLLGVAQWLVLRPYVAASYDWILTHAAGWVAGYTLGVFVVQWLSSTPVGMLVGFIAFGVIVAVFQYPIFRREMPHLAAWVLANVVGWTLGVYLSLLAVGGFFQNAVPNTVTSVLVTVGITGLVAGAVTAVALIWIVRQPDRPEA